MNCYDCSSQGLTRQAVAICASCGAAVCQNCARLESVDHEQNVSLGNPVHRVTRTLNCRSCDAVLGDRLMSASRV